MSAQFAWSIKPMGEAALLVEASPAGLPANHAVLSLADRLTAMGLPGVEATVPAISSLLIIFDPLLLASTVLRAQLEPMLADVTALPDVPARVLTIPVSYGGDAGPDLTEVAAQLGIRPAEVVALHCQPVYSVFMLGFAPGFPYLGPLPAALSLPRRTTPRTAVPAGSVAIAAGMTGIYPDRLPGGWHVLGRTEQRLFDPAADPPSLLVAGDGVRFEPVAGGVMP